MAGGQSRANQMLRKAALPPPEPDSRLTLPGSPKPGALWMVQCGGGGSVGGYNLVGIGDHADALSRPAEGMSPTLIAELVLQVIEARLERRGAIVGPEVHTSPAL